MNASNVKIENWWKTTTKTCFVASMRRHAEDIGKRSVFSAYKLTLSSNVFTLKVRINPSGYEAL